MIEPSALLGTLGRQTASVYVLDPITGTPLEPIPDTVPGVSPLRWVPDLIESEQATRNYEVTRHSMQDFSDATTQAKRGLIELSISCALADSLQMPSGAVGSAPTFGVRLDMTRMANLRAIADVGDPVMVVTPRHSLPAAFITSISEPWSPDEGASSLVTVSFLEARIVSPITGALLPNYAGLLPGKNADTGGGQQTAQPTGLTTTASTIPNGAPTPS